MSAGDFWPFINDVSERIQSGDLTGPRVYTAGPLFTAPGGHPAATFCGIMDMRGPNPWCSEHLTEEVDTPEEVRAAVARLSRGGVNQIKFVFDGTSGPGVNDLEAELVEEIVTAAHEHGLRTYAHIFEIPKAITAIESGLDGLVHLPAVTSQPDETERLVRLMEAEGVAASTTLTTFDSMMEIAAEQGDDGLRDAMSGLLDGMKQTLARVNEVDEGLIVLGTDAPHLPPADAYHREIELVSEAGLTPERIIQAATRDAAKYLGLGDELGTLEPGMLADLIVVDGNPLADLSVLQEIRSVVKGGEIK
jgi:enamidase